MRGGYIGKALMTAALAVITGLAAAPAHAAGFSIFEQGAKAMGMAGAFTAQADDPSLLFHNAGGLAFVQERQISTGVTWIHGIKADFDGAAPFPGPGYSAKQKALSEFPPHLYWLQPITDTWKFGLGINSPFGLTTEWEKPDQFAGRFLSSKAALRVVDVNPTMGWQVTPSFGIGVGAIARVSDVQLERSIGANNPFTQRISDVGRLKLESDYGSAYGFNLGILHKFNNSFSWGLSYRSAITVDYKGDARAAQVSTGNAQFDAAVRAQIPFGKNLPVKTSIDFPDEASLGLAFSITPDLLLETDYNWTGWSSFQEVKIDFTGGTLGGSGNALPDATIREEWKDANNYRAGLRWSTSPVTQWRFGYVYDETPQPEEAVSPLLPDADRNGFTIGYGHNGPGIGFDVAFMYLDFKERTRDQSFAPNPGGAPEPVFFGTYNTKAYLLSATVNW